MSNSFQIVLVVLAFGFLIGPVLDRPAWAIEAPKAPAPQPVPLTITIRPIETDDLAWLAEAAQRGHPMAQYSLALAYRRGKGVPQDAAQQHHWIGKAAETGFGWGHYELGRILETGEAGAADLAKAIESYKKAAEKNIIPALRRLADLYETGPSPFRNPSIGAGWRTRLAAAEDRERRFLDFARAEGAKSRPDDELATQIKALAEEGLDKASALLGQWRLSGRGGAKDVSAAVALLGQAGQQGSCWGPYMIGRLKIEGREIARDPGPGLDLVRRAIRENCLIAMDYLAGLTERGELVPQDVDGALMLYRLAAEQGFANSAFRLGQIYEKGSGVGADRARALAWYKKAAERNHAQARIEVARLEGKPAPNSVTLQAEAAKLLQEPAVREWQNLSLTHMVNRRCRFFHDATSEAHGRQAADAEARLRAKTERAESLAEIERATLALANGMACDAKARGLVESVRKRVADQAWRKGADH